MFSRYFFTFFMLVLVAAVVNISAQEAEVDDDYSYEDDESSLEVRISFVRILNIINNYV